MADSGWKLIVEQEQKAVRQFFWCAECWAHLELERQKAVERDARPPFDYVMPASGRSVHPVQDIYQTRDDTCARCGRTPT